MDVPLGMAVGVLVLGLILMFIVALAEVSLATISRTHVRKLGEEGVSSALMVEGLLQDAERFLSGILVLRTVAIVAAVGAATWLAFWLNVQHVLVWILLGLGVLLLLLQVGGRVLAVQYPTTTALRVVGPIRWLIMLAAPVTWLLLRLVNRTGVRDAESGRNIFLSEDGLRLLLNFGEEERFIEADEREMIDSIFRFSETNVGEVMVPRVDVVALEQNATLQDALDMIVEAGHSRIPVYDDNIDRIVGVLYAKDLLTCYRDGTKDILIQRLMRKPYFVPESAMVDDLLTDLQRKKTHLAIVVDEYGGTAGVVTLEDMLEEIVGEIQDEYDSETPVLHEVDEGTYLVSGRIDIDDLNRHVGVELSDEDESYTLAGLVYSNLQRVPDVGDTLEVDNVLLEVLEVTDNRIEQVRLSVIQPADENGKDDMVEESA